jgi:FkbM family methyltransferase
MGLVQLLSRKRYNRCARLFQRPLLAHVLTSLPLPGKMRLELANGETLHVADRRCRRIFQGLLDRWPDPFPVTVRRGLVRFNFNGEMFALRPNYADFMAFSEIMFRDTYGLGALSAPVGTVVDLGANIGIFSLRAASVAERVIAVEPVGSNLDMAERVLAEGGVRHKVSLHRAAICRESGGNIRVFANPRFPAGNSVFQRHTSYWGGCRHEEVPKLSVADLFAKEQVGRCSLLKCDIEGAEFDAFEAAPLSLLQRIDRIAMEVHPTIEARGCRRFAGLRRRLEAAGFQVTHSKTRRWWGARRQAVMLTAVNRWAETRPEDDIISFRLKRVTSPPRAGGNDLHKAAPRESMCGS